MMFAPPHAGILSLLGWNAMPKSEFLSKANCENSVACGRPAHVPISLRARTSVLDMCQEEEVIGSSSVRDSSQEMIG